MRHTRIGGYRRGSFATIPHMGDFTAEEIEAVRAAYLRGELSVTYGDQTMSFSSTKDMAEILDRTRTSGRPRIRYPRLTGGYN